MLARHLVHANRIVARRSTLALAIAATAVCSTSVLAADGTWITAAPGTYTYGDAANWQAGTVAAGTDATANFNTLDLTGTVVVNVATDPTIGSMTFGDTDVSTVGGYQFTGGPLTIAGTNATLTANALGTGGTVRFDTVLAGTSNLTVTGPGTVHFAAANTLSGNVTLNNANVLLGSGSTFALINAAGSTLTLNGTNTISNGGSASGTMSLQSNVVASAGSVTTINMGNRTEVGQKTIERTWTGSGTVNFNMATNVSRNDFTANLTGLTGQVNISAQQVTAANGDTVSPVGRMLINGGRFGAGFTNAKVALNDFAVLQAITNSGGNTINFGELSGTSATAGFISPTAGAANLSIGGLNTNSTFAGLFVGNNIVTKVGTGSLTLTSSQYNTNSTNVNAGTLALSGSGDLPLSPTINIANGATFDVSGMSSGAYKIHGVAVTDVSNVQTLQTAANSTVTVKGNLDLSEGSAVLQPGGLTGASTINVNGNLNLAGGILNMELSPSLTPGGTNDLLNVTGATTLGGNLQLNVGLLGGLSAGTYTLVQSTGGISGSTGGWNVVFGGRGTAPSLTQTATALQLTVSSISGASLKFTGAAGNGNWDINTTANWLNTGSNAADKFFQLDSVRFDDTASTSAVTLVSSVAPSAIVVDTTNGYTFSGTGALIGNGTLTKRGTGTLTISNSTPNTFSGGTTLEAGTLDIGTLGQNGIGTGKITLAGGTLRAITPTGGNITLANDIDVTGAANFITANSGTTARQTILAGAITGSGALNITNDNSASPKGLDIVNTSGFTGSMVVNDNLAVRFSSATNGNAGMALTINGTGGVGTIISTAAVIPIGSLSGDGTLRGHQSSGTGSTVEYQIGGLNSNTTFSGTVVDGAQGTGAGSVRPVLITKVGSGTLSLTGANTYTGATTVKSGTLFLGTNAQGPVLGNATVTAPGGADIQGGKLVLSYVGGTSSASQVQSLLTAGYGQTTKFATGLLRSSTLGTNRTLGWRDNATDQQVEVAYTLAGDADLNFKVEFADLLTLAKNYNGTGKVWAQGDFTYDASVGFDDLLALAKNYNGTVSAAQSAQLSSSFAADFAFAQSLVPEPGTISLLGMGAAALLRRRRRD